MVTRHHDVEKTPWEEWFAWRPVMTLDGETIWCRKCYRRYVKFYHGVNPNRWQYANIFTILK